MFLEMLEQENQPWDRQHKAWKESGTFLWCLSTLNRLFQPAMPGQGVIQDLS